MGEGSYKTIHLSSRKWMKFVVKFMLWPFCNRKDHPEHTLEETTVLDRGPVRTL